MCAFCREGPGDSQPYSPCSACHDCGLARKICVHAVLLSGVGALVWRRWLQVVEVFPALTGGSDEQPRCLPWVCSSGTPLVEPVPSAPAAMIALAISGVATPPACISWTRG